MIENKLLQFILVGQYILNDTGAITYDIIEEINQDIFTKYIIFINDDDNKTNYLDFNSFLKELSIQDKMIDLKINIIKEYIENMKYGFIPVGFIKHAVGLFFYKNDDDTIDISIINTGDGCEYHDNIYKENDIYYTNGIIIFQRVPENRAIFGICYLIFMVLNSNYKQDKIFVAIMLVLGAFVFAYTAFIVKEKK
jgi:hypothetical protein